MKPKLAGDPWLCLGVGSWRVLCNIAAPRSQGKVLGLQTARSQRLGFTTLITCELSARTFME